MREMITVFIDTETISEMELIEGEENENEGIS